MPFDAFFCSVVLRIRCVKTICQVMILNVFMVVLFIHLTWKMIHLSSSLLLLIFHLQFDRPFLFLVYDNVNKVLLFCAKVEQ